MRMQIVTGQNEMIRCMMIRVPLTQFTLLFFLVKGASPSYIPLTMNGEFRHMWTRKSAFPNTATVFIQLGDYTHSDINSVVI